MSGVHALPDCVRDHEGMRALGIRLWANKLGFVVLDDSSDPPTVVDQWHGPMAKNAAGPERLEWVRREVAQAIERNNVDRVAVRVCEPTARKQDPLRAEAEGVAQLAALQLGKPVDRYFSGNMARALGASAKGAFAAYSKSDPLVSTLPADERDAAMAAQVALIGIGE